MRTPVTILSLVLAYLPALCTGQDAETAQQFDTLYRQATAAYEKKDYGSAIQGYRDAADLIPHPTALYNLACCYALNGQPNEALSALEESIVQGFDDKDHALADPDFESVRQLPRFQEIVNKIKGVDGAAETLELSNDPQLRAVNYYVSLPEGHDPSHKYPVILALPPGEGNKSMVQAGLNNYWQSEAKTRGYLVVSVELQGQLFAGRANSIVTPILKAVHDKYGGDLERVALGGFSNGGIGAVFVLLETWAERPFRAMLGLPGALPPGVSPEALGDLEGFPFFLRVGEQDESWIPPIEQTAALLKAQGAEVDLEQVPGQGHVLQLDQAALFDWIDQKLGLSGDF